MHTCLHAASSLRLYSFLPELLAATNNSENDHHEWVGTTVHVVRSHCNGNRSGGSSGIELVVGAASALAMEYYCTSILEMKLVGSDRSALLGT